MVGNSGLLMWLKERVERLGEETNGIINIDWNRSVNARSTIAKRP